MLLLLLIILNEIWKNAEKYQSTYFLREEKTCIKYGHICAYSYAAHNTLLLDHFLSHLSIFRNLFSGLLAHSRFSYEKMSDGTSAIIYRQFFGHWARLGLLDWNEMSGSFSSSWKEENDADDFDFGGGGGGSNGVAVPSSSMVGWEITCNRFRCTTLHIIQLILIIY